MLEEFLYRCHMLSSSSVCFHVVIVRIGPVDCVDAHRCPVYIVVIEHNEEVLVITKSSTLSRKIAQVPQSFAVITFEYLFRHIRIGHLEIWRQCAEIRRIGLNYIVVEPTVSVQHSMFVSTETLKHRSVNGNGLTVGVGHYTIKVTGPTRME